MSKAAGGARTRWTVIAIVLGATLAVWRVWTVLSRANGWQVFGREFVLFCLVNTMLLIACGTFLWEVNRRYQRDKWKAIGEDESEAFDKSLRSSLAYGTNAGICAGVVGSLSAFLYVFCGESIILASIPVFILTVVLAVRKARHFREDKRRGKNRGDE
jgi:hypothetical protein